MKKSDFMNLIASEDGTLHINPICSLRRWTVDCCGQPVDKLKLEFHAINGMRLYTTFAEIHSRDYDGVKVEIESAIRAKVQELSDYLCSAFRNGYTVPSVHK